MPETNESNRQKLNVLRKIGIGVIPTKASGPSNYYLGGRIIHARFCGTNERSAHLYKFNINPNTIQADYELWICGSDDLYYILPIEIIKQIYHDPNSYVDNRHPNIRVVSVNVSTNKIIFKTSGGKLDIGAYRNKIF